MVIVRLQLLTKQAQQSIPCFVIIQLINFTHNQMRKLLTNILSLLFLLISLQVSAQQSEYPIKKINGVEYYVYTVQAGEGLYAISRKFNISQADINTLNPQIQTGLKSGQEILLPITQKQPEKKTDEKAKVHPSSSEQNEPSVKNQVLTEVQFVEHIVQKKQTLFAITRKYNVSQDDIQKYNPQIEGGLKEGMVLRIPVITEKSKSNEKADKKQHPTETSKKQNEIKRNQSVSKDTTTYITHKVKEKETLYSISKLYNVETEDIITVNPKAAKGLKVGSELKIPHKRTIIIKKDSVPVVDKVKEIQNEIKRNTRISESVKPNKEPIRIAFLLPFMLESTKADPNNDKFNDFYAGALMAINEAKEFGVSTEIYTYDTEKNEEKIVEVLNKPELKNVDFIIGPAYTNQISYVSDFAKENRINTLIPFSSKVFDVNTNPYLLQFNPGVDVEAKFVAELMNNEFKTEEIVFFQLPNVNYSDDGNEFCIQLQNKLNALKRSYKVIDVTDEQSTALSTSNKTIVFFNTDKFSLINPYINALSSATNASEITLYEQYSWQNANMQGLKTFSVAPFKPETNGVEFKKFSNNLSTTFDWKPSSYKPRYDLLGYDLTNYFIAQIYRWGANFNVDKNKLPQSAGIQSQFKFERSSERSGYMNKQLYLIQSDK